MKLISTNPKKIYGAILFVLDKNCWFNFIKKELNNNTLIMECILYR